MALLIILLSLFIGSIYCLEGRALVCSNNEIASQAETWEQSSLFAPTPGNFNRHTPSVYCPSPNRLYAERSTSLPRSGRLGFHDEARSGNDPSYDDDSPRCIKYLIEWRALLNNRIVARDTEQDLVLKPSSYWKQIKEKADQVVRQKKARNQRVRSDDTTIVVSVNERSQRDLTKRFETNDIDWAVIERQLLEWESLFRKGKRLRLSISISYLGDGNPSPPGKTDKRGPSSTTNTMLREWDDQVDAEESSGQPSVWRDVYRVMRCPGPPCHHEGQYCWQDPVSKKHYRLRTHHMRSLVKYVESKKGVIETHDDIPENIRDQLRAEEEQQIGRRQKAPDLLGTGFPPININVLPTQSSQALVSSSSGDPPSRIEQLRSMKIPGPFEVTLKEYTQWHLTRVSTASSRDNIMKAHDIALENGLDLKQIFSDNNPEFFHKQGVKIGFARRFGDDIPLWLEDRENRNDTEDT